MSMQELSPSPSFPTLPSSPEDSFSFSTIEDDEAQTFDRSQINEMLLELGVRPSLRENVRFLL